LAWDLGQSPGPRVYVVIPVHNRLDFTRRCLSTLKLSTWANIEVVVIDDGSTDGTKEALRAEYPEVTVLAGDGSLWWTGAMAEAVETLRARFQAGEFVMSVNNDTQVEPNTVSRLIEVSVAHGRAIVAAAARRGDGRYIAAGALLLFDRTLGASVGLRRKEGKGALNVVEADAVFGRATLVPVEAFDVVGNYRPREFPQYWGDSDFSLRARRAGIRQLVTFSTIVRCAEDARTTGLHHVPQRIVSVRQAAQMLFSRRSNLCLLYAARFMWLHAPQGLKLASVVRQCSKSCRMALERTLPGLVFFSAVLLLRHMARRIRRMAARMLPDQLLTYPEMRRLGFDPTTLVRERVVVAGRIRHAYWIIEPFMKMWRAHPEYRRLMLHSRNPVNRVRKALWFRRAERWQRRRRGRGGRNV
jgi:GT2 family glycosyltransferase